MLCSDHEVGAPLPLNPLAATQVRVPVAQVDSEEAEGKEDPGDAVYFGHGVKPGCALLATRTTRGEGDGWSTGLRWRVWVRVERCLADRRRRCAALGTACVSSTL